MEGEHISANDGEVVLRGRFMMSFPNGEIVGPLMDGGSVALFFDHLGGSIWINGTQIEVFDAENPQLGNSSCGKFWLVYQHTAAEDDVFEIHLRNPHAFGNGLAVDQFLDSMRIYTGDDFEFLLEQQTENLRIIGCIIIFVAVFILGIAMFSSLLRMDYSEIMCPVGMTILCAGSYFVVYSTESYTLNTNAALNTAVYLLSILMYVSLLHLLIVQIFEKPLKKAGNMVALYNALGAIRELCRQDPEDARNALGTFITYLRGNMESIQKEHTISFSKELNHILAYLQLEKLRFGEDLQVVFDIQETNFMIPSLTIQPIVENAVKHGICSREEGGTVTLHTHREDDHVIVTIQDDGVGFDIDTLEKLEHVGIQNVRKRLNYMGNGTLTIESRKNVGTTVTITIYDRKD